MMVEEEYASPGVFIAFDVSVDGESFNDFVRRRIYDSDQFIPYSVGVLSEYAEPVEFGTSPMGGMTHNKAGVKRDSEGRIIRNENLRGIPFSKIYEWALKKKNSVSMQKYGLRTDADAKAFAYNVATRIKKYGMPAQPFIRPAIYNTLDDLPDDFFTKEGNSIELIADMIVEEMVRILYENDTICSGDLINSIYKAESAPDDTVFDLSSRRSNESGPAIPSAERLTRTALNRDEARAKRIRNNGRKNSVNRYEKRAGLNNKRPVNKQKLWADARARRKRRCI